MPGSPWLALKQAREALRNGQPDEAGRLLAPLAADGHRQAVGMVRDVALAHLTRAERHLRGDDAESAWRELVAAEGLNTSEETAVRLRQTLTRLGLAQCRAALEAGQPLQVAETIARLRDRRAGGPEVDVLDDAAQGWLLASDQADRGEFTLAEATLDRVRRRLDPALTTGLGQFAAGLTDRGERFRTAIARLNEAAEDRNWSAVVRWADDVTAAAPDHREVRALRAKAWTALYPDDAGQVVPLVRSVSPDLETDTTLTYPGSPTPRPSSHPGPTSSVSLPGTPGLPRRFLLWVDGVGGYLVCLDKRVTFGQATADGPVDVPLFADVSRMHAEVTRDTEGYVVESGRDIQVNGKPAKRSPLAPGDRVTLGATCQFQFQQPVGISPTVRLELMSGQRFPLAVDGVILMAESLILGPGERVHVRIPWVKSNVILYRTADGLGVRYDLPFTVDGRPAEGGRSPLPVPGAVIADAFGFAIEAVGPRL